MTSFQQYRDHHDAQGPLVLETVPAAGRRYQGDRAGFVIRAIAAVLDVVFVGIIVVLLWIGLWLFLLIFNPIVDPDLTVEVTHRRAISCSLDTSSCGCTGRGCGRRTAEAWVST